MATLVCCTVACMRSAGAELRRGAATRCENQLETPAARTGAQVARAAAEVVAGRRAPLREKASLEAAKATRSSAAYAERIVLLQPCSRERMQARER